MFRSKTQFFVVALLLTLALTLGVSQSQACWRCGGGGWGGYYDGWYSPWTTWYAGYGYGYGYGWGGWGGWRHGWRHGCCGWSSPCWGCGCGAVADCGCGGAVADCGCGGTVTVPSTLQPTPAQPTPAPAQPNTAPALPPTPQPPAPGTSTEYFPTSDTSGLLTVSVPADAKVLVNGRLTQSTGSTREFVTHNLVPGLTYKFTVVAQIVRDGQIVEDTKVVTLTAGSREGLAFGFNPKAADQLAQSN